MADGINTVTYIRPIITLFDTTGFIDRDNNIYYCPSASVLKSEFSGSSMTISALYYRALTTVCPPPFTEYTDIEISRWSPEDRKLVVKGDILFFRKSSVNQVNKYSGHTLNYLVVRTGVTAGNTTSTLSTGYFISNVRQAGIDSVELELVPDAFTNAYYLQNGKTITNTTQLDTFDPFNDSIKNALVERQHLDRFTVVNNTAQLNANNLQLFLNPKETYNFKYQYRQSHRQLPVAHNEDVFSQEDENHISEALENTDTLNDRVAWLWNEYPDTFTKIIKSCICYVKVVLKENMNIPIYIRKFEDVEVEGEFVNQQTQLKIDMTNCGMISGNVPSPLCVVYYPFFNLTKQMKDAGVDLFLSRFRFGVNLHYRVNSSTTLQAFYNNILTSSEEVLNRLAKRGYGDYIQSITIEPFNYLTDKVYVKRDVVGGSNNWITAYWEVDVARHSSIVENETEDYDMYNDDTGEYDDTQPDYLSPRTVVGTDHLSEENFNVGSIDLCVLQEYPKQKETPRNRNTHIIPRLMGQFEIKYDADNNQISLTTVRDGLVGLSSSLVASVPLTYTLDDMNMSKSYIKNRWFDVTLMGKPYTFYGISFLGNLESTFTLDRYFNTISYSSNYLISKLNLDFICPSTNVQRYHFIPKFRIIGREQRYYSESLDLTLQDSYPVVSDSYWSYKNQNQAQMRNQYAVYENEWEKGYYTGAISDMTGAINKGLTKGNAGALGGGIIGIGNAVSKYVAKDYDIKSIQMSQQAKLADVGSRPDTVKQTGSDYASDLQMEEYALYLNKYTIDDISYNYICRYLERFGYKLGYVTTLDCFSRKGWNYIELTEFDFVENTGYKLSEAQASAIREIFIKGVTLLHDRNYLENHGQSGYHNYEVTLD